MCTSEIEVGLDALAEGAARWASTSLADKRAVLTEVRDQVARVAPGWVAAACRSKGLATDTPLAGEEWITGPYPVLAYIDALLWTIRRVEAGRSPLDGLPTRIVPGDRLAVRILPFEPYDRVLLSGYRGEVWLRPGVTAARARADCARGLRPGARSGGVVLVLGAGNINSIPPLDVLYQLVAENAVVLLKLNPANDYLGSILAEAFAPLIRRGFVRLVSGGAEVGAALTRHPHVSAVHVTGSNATHDAIVFGSGPDGERRKAAGTPLLDKPITSELGGVGPTVVVPGPWNAADLAFHAAHLATQKLHNNGYNCIAGQVAVLPREWERTPDFVDALRGALRSAPHRAPYYPGATDRLHRFLADYPGAERFDGGQSPRALVTDLPADGDEPAFRTEYFGPVYATTLLPGRSPAAFLNEAVTFCNERLYGSLGANILIHPTVAAGLGSQLDEAIGRLRYGNIAVNTWVGFNFVTPRGHWGAYPGHDLRDAGSGIGGVHNALLLADAERTVMRGPFRPAPRSLMTGQWSISPRPPWFVDHRAAHIVGERLTRFAATPSWRRLVAVLPSALRG